MLHFAQLASILTIPDDISTVLALFSASVLYTGQSEFSVCLQCCQFVG